MSIDKIPWNKLWDQTRSDHKRTFRCRAGSLKSQMQSIFVLKFDWQSYKMLQANSCLLPIFGQGDWNFWSSCSKSCGSGVHRRHREVMTAPWQSVTEWCLFSWFCPVLSCSVLFCSFCIILFYLFCLFCCVLFVFVWVSKRAIVLDSRVGSQLLEYFECLIKQVFRAVCTMYR